MKYTDEQIKKNLTEFIESTGQHEIRYIISYCLGYYGYISNQIWHCITAIIDAE